MSLFAELKRRNVFRVAAAYVVSAWLLIEVGNTLEETLRLPDWTDTLLAFFLIIGFPVALFVSWAYEITPEGIRREKEVEVEASSRSATARKLNQLTFMVMALALVYFALDKWVFTGGGGMSPATTEVAAEAPANAAPAMQPTPLQPAKEATPSVAVLPFVNMSADADNEYFSDGISEELLNLLVKVDGLRVPSRTSSFAFKGLNTDIKEIARQLDVGHILEGSVRKAGNRVRVTAQLIDVATDTHLWSETYDRELEDIFAIQDEIAGHIVGNLELALSPDHKPRQPTRSLAAYNHLLQARFLFQQRSADSLLEAEQVLQQAVQLDPEFAEAWAQLAMIYTVLPNYLFEDSRQFSPKALAAAERARELDPSLPEPLLVLAQTAESELRWSEALALYREALARQPRHSTGLLWYGITLLESGYVSEALAQLQRSVEADPLAGINLDWYARALYMQGEVTAATEAAERSLELGRRQGIRTWLAMALDTGDPEPGQLIARKHLADPGYRDYWINQLEMARAGLAGDTVQKRATELEADPEAKISLYSLLTLYQVLRDTGRYTATLAQIRQFDDTIITSVWWPDAKWLRQQPAMKSVAAEYAWPGLWRERGWPDRCRPLGDDDFECD